MLAFAFGMCTDAWHLAVPLGIILELFWIDLLRLGASVPPSAALALTLIIPCCLIFHWHEPALVTVPLFICIPFAHTATWLERYLRVQNNRSIALVEAWIRTDPHTISLQKTLSPCRAISIALCRSALCYTALYAACLSTLYLLFSYLIRMGLLPHASHMTWHLMCSLGLIGAILGLRTKRAYSVLVVCLCFILLYTLGLHAF